MGFAKLAIVFLAGGATFVGGLLLWLGHGGDLAIHAPRTASEAKAIAIQQAAPEKPCYDRDYYDVSQVVVPEGIVLTGDPPQDYQDKMALKTSFEVGLRLASASDHVRWHLLDRANEYCCMKCGEVNPATLRKGYPPESCHKCQPRVIRDRMKAADRQPGDPEYLPEGTPISQVKTSK